MPRTRKKPAAPRWGRPSTRVRLRQVAAALSVLLDGEEVWRFDCLSVADAESWAARVTARLLPGPPDDAAYVEWAGSYATCRRGEGLTVVTQKQPVAE